jgi:two-component system, chemotaxis family, sensor kinase CheA
MPDRVAEATDLWLGYEQGHGRNLAVLRRLLHTLKGEAHMLDLALCGELTELAELVVDAVHACGTPTQLTGDSLLTAFEAMGLLSDGAGEEAEADLDAVRRTLQAARLELETRPSCAADTPPLATAVLAHDPPHEPARPERAAPPVLDAEAAGALVQEMRRLYGEREVILHRLRESQRMLRALLVEINPRGSPERLAERITKTLSYGAEIERSLGSVRSDWSSNDFATGRALDDLEELVRKASVVRIERLLNQVSLTGRSAARALGKDVEVSVEGTGLLDTTVERRLEPALLHLVRNAIDHGIEPPEVRIARGKPPRGHVRVEIVQADSTVHVEVRDDGGGVAFSRLREVLAPSVPDVAALDDSDLVPYLFTHGLTTSRSVGAISGRGVGLDIVARQVGALGGQVRIDSKPEVGTTIALAVPIHLHGEEVVPVSAGRYRCAVPTRTVHSVVLLDEVLRTSDGRRVRLTSGIGPEVVALFALGAVLGDAAEPRPGDAALVLHHAAGLFAVSVDSYENPRPITVVRSEDMPFESPLVRGVAPTADGGTMLLLDVERLFIHARHAAENVSPVAAAERRRQPVALVVEDAPVARELLCGMLRSLGLHVEEAADGRAGLERAQSSSPDVILTDIEMPYMSGMEMICELRRSPALSSIPVVVLTTAADDQNLVSLEGLGVRAVLSKQRFVEEELRTIVMDCIGEP